MPDSSGDRRDAVRFMNKNSAEAALGGRDNKAGQLDCLDEYWIHAPRLNLNAAQSFIIIAEFLFNGFLSNFSNTSIYEPMYYPIVLTSIIS